MTRTPSPARSFLALVPLLALVALPVKAQLEPLYNDNLSQTTGDGPKIDDQWGGAVATGDFNGDGYTDLAVAAPAEDTSGASDTGSVEVIYGSADGLDTESRYAVLQNGTGGPEQDDLFGVALAAIDVDNDNYDDLVVGAAGESLSAKSGVGAIEVLFGSATGLSASNYQALDPGTGGAAGDGFGSALAVGDFDDDGYGDVAVGSPYDDVSGSSDAGSLAVYYGSDSGLATPPSLFSQAVTGVGDSPEDDDRFAFALTSGDFDGDDYDDLVIGVPGETSGAPARIAPLDSDQGAVHVLYGGAGGLSSNGRLFVHQGLSGLSDTAENNDLFGYSLATGDFDDNGYDDLAVGVPGEGVSDREEGAVHLIYGNADGLDPDDDALFHQDTLAVEDDAEIADGFGTALTSGDFDGDLYHDLAIGVPGEDLSSETIANAGVVEVLYGMSSGISAAGDDLLSQGALYDSAIESDDEMGTALAAGDFDGNGADDLVVGVPLEDASAADVGMIHVVYGLALTVFADTFESGDTTRWTTSP